MNDVPGYEHIPGRYGVEIERTDSGTSTFVPLRPDLAAPDGGLRIAAVLMGIDMGAGITAGQAVLPGWTVTADIETHLAGGCTAPLGAASGKIHLQTHAANDKTCPRHLLLEASAKYVPAP